MTAAHTRQLIVFVGICVVSFTANVAVQAPTPPCRELTVRRFINANGIGPNLTDAQAETILAAATATLRTNDGAGDRPCKVFLGLAGNVTTFRTGDGSIDSSAEYDALVAQAGNVFVVNAINWCGSLVGNAVGCGDTPGTAFVVVRTGNEGIVWAHEHGHNRGLEHRDEWPSLAFLTGDVDGDADNEVFHLWRNDNSLAVDVYQRGAGSGLVGAFKQEGLAATRNQSLGFHTGDFDDDGDTDILEVSSHGSQRLGMRLFAGSNSGFSLLWQTTDVGQGSGALAWLVGDIDGDGQADLLQPWRNGSQLGLIVYSWNGTRMTTKWGTQNIGQGYGALSWLVGDVDGDGNDDLLQPWRNGATLGLIVYSWDGTRMTTKFGTTDIGQGYGALAWRIADVDGDTTAELLQPWRNGSQLGLIVYGWDGARMTTKWGTPNIGQGYGALTWLVADVDGVGGSEFLQPWRNGSQLGLIVYGWDGARMTTKWATEDIGQGFGALKWLTANTNTDSRWEVLQLWQNRERLGVIMYGWDGSRMVTTWGTARQPPGPDAIMNLSAAATHNKVSATECAAYR
jgi:hypothetical protein